MTNYCMTYLSNPKVTSWQRQIVMGTILGGSSVVKPPRGKNCYLFMRGRNRLWLQYKAAELKNLASDTPFTEEKTTMRWHSNCYPLFSEFREIFYVDNKKIVTMEVLDQLRDIALAIWYGDCGRILKDKTIINTSHFGEEGTRIVVQYFNEVGVTAVMHQERNRFRVQLEKEGARKLFGIIDECLPEFMISKDHNSNCYHEQ